MKLRFFLLTVIALCGILSAQAQTLVIYDARDLFPKDAWNPPCKAVFTEDYYYSEEWLSLKDRIDTYLLYQTAKENPDWIPLAASRAPSPSPAVTRRTSSSMLK